MPASIDILNDYCLAKIFSYLLPQKRLEIEQVCTRWQAVAQENWHDMKGLNLSRLDNSTLEKNRRKFYMHKVARQLLARCGRFLEYLSIPPIYNSKILEVVHDNCRNLITLHLHLRKYSKNHLLGVFSNMKKLQLLVIQNREGKLSFFDCLQSVPEGITGIQLGAKEFCDESFRPYKNHVLEKFTNLQMITMENFQFSSSAVEAIARNKNLHHLDIPDCPFDRNASLMPFSHFKELQYLDISAVGNGATDSFLKSLAENSTKLLSLDISSSKSISNRGLNELVKFQHLEELFIDAIQFTVNGSIKLWPLPKLKRLHCNYGGGIDDEIIKKVLDHSPEITYLECCAGSVTIETLKYAATITENRSDDQELCISVREDVEREFNKLGEISPYLEVIGCPYSQPPPS